MKLFEQIESKLLLVEKPARYIGGEKGSIVKDHSAKLKFALAFPEIYEVGISHFGSSIIYNIVNEEFDLLCERVYMPAEDMRNIMIEKNIPLFSLETKTPLNRFDVLGFTLENELSYTNVLEMLELSNIPLSAEQRDENDPIVIAGGTCVFNPEPMADFFDLFYIGDAELSLIRMLKFIYRNKNNSPRIDLLRQLAQFDGIYVPAFYHPRYENGKFAGYNIDDDVPYPVRSATVDKLERKFYPNTPIVPWIESVHDRIRTELSRGCGQGCRFCQAGYIYRPVREQLPDDVINQLRTQFNRTGYDELGVISLSATDYTSLDELFLEMRPWLERERLKFSLPSIRIEQLGEFAFEILGSNRKVNLTFAPESGTERLRRVINKPLDEEKFYSAIRSAFQNNWRNVKLYFMIGLPTETQSDIQGIVDMLENVSDIARKYNANVRVTISPFVPKSHTPFQWEKQNSLQQLEQKEDYIRRNCPANIQVFAREPEISVLEGIFARGDRRLCQVIFRAWKNGAIYSAWNELFRPDIFFEALENQALEIDSFIHQREIEEPLPWDIIDKGIDRKFLQQEREKAYNEIITPACEERDCEKCPYCDIPPQILSKQKHLKQEGKKQYSEKISYGRRVRKKQEKSSNQLVRVVRIKYSAMGRARFFGHLDKMKILERAFRMAKFPLTFTSGYHSHPRLQFSPPIPLGYESRSEYMDVFVSDIISPGNLHRFQNALPDFFNVLQHRVLPNKPKSLQSLVKMALWHCEIPLPPDEVYEMLSSVSASDKIEFQRHKKVVNIRPLLIKFAIEPETKRIDNKKTLVKMLLKAGNDGSGRPMEFFLAFGKKLEVIVSGRYIREELLIPSDDGWENPLGNKIIIEDTL
ncbi:TIGR03960 family B12-binding radical SAM protein [bacterium]|nr:MAG: TIGR03960 family B12-binding radical SAM protein [bacterium]